MRLERNYRSGQRILDAAGAVVAGGGERIEKQLRGAQRRRGALLALPLRARAGAGAWRRRCERLVAQEGVPPEEICVLVRSVKNEGADDRRRARGARGAVPADAARAAYFQRAEVRDVLAWLRLLADPGDSGAVVRALTRPPIELRSVDIARLTQLARRRRLDMVAAWWPPARGRSSRPRGATALQAFLRLYRSASTAFEEMRPDVFVHRLIERIGLRRQQVFAAQADTVERLVNIAKLSELATRVHAPSAGGHAARLRPLRRRHGGGRDCARRRSRPTELAPAVQVMTMRSAKGREFDYVLVGGLNANRMPGGRRAMGDGVPDELLKE